MAIYWATVGRVLAKVRPAILGLAARHQADRDRAAGAQVSGSQPFALTDRRELRVTSSAMLGGACTAMILGHWYLVIPSLRGSSHRSRSSVHIGSLLARIAVVGAAVWFAIDGHARRQPGRRPDVPPRIMSVDASSSGSA